jgi:hypothetical protein
VGKGEGNSRKEEAGMRGDPGGGGRGKLVGVGLIVWRSSITGYINYQYRYQLCITWITYRY